MLYAAFMEHSKSFSGIRINEFRFSPCEDGVLIQNDALSFAWIHDQWKRIDMLVRHPLQHTPAFHALMMRAYQYTALHAGGLLIHAAAVTHQGSGILFCGVPGAGKSTQARLWESTFDAETINNDQPCIVYEGEKAYVSGSPWSGKEPCYKNLCVPVKAIVFVEKSPENRIAPILPAEAYSLLYLNEYVIPVQPETEAAYKTAITRLLQAVPVYRQFCTMTEDAPNTLRTFLEM